MVSFALSFALGVWYLQQMEALPTIPVYWPMALLCLLLPRTLPQLLRIGEQHILLTGDIERLSEERLLLRHPDKLQANLLVAPHHGSRSSSSPPFVAAVAPQHVVFTAGYRNRFHHPHPEVVRRYLRQDSQILRSDRDGAIIIDLQPSGIKLDSFRHSHRRYWSHMP